MSRTLTAAMQTAIARADQQIILLAEIETDSTPIRAWTGAGDIVFEGNTFSGVGEFGSVSQIEETTEIAARGISFGLSGIPSSLLSSALQDMRQGRTAKLWFGIVKNPILDNYVTNGFFDEVKLDLPGAAGDFASTPDSPDFNITGNIDVRCLISPADWSPIDTQTIIAQWNDTGNQFSWIFQLRTDGTVRLDYSLDGSSIKGGSSTVATGFANELKRYVRFTLDVDNGDSGQDIKYYTSTDGIVWNQLGTTVTVGGTGSLFNSTADVQIGANEQTGAFNEYIGKIYKAQVLDGIDGPLIFDADFRKQTPGAPSFSESSNNKAVVTINGNASLVIDLSGWIDGSVAPATISWNAAGYMNLTDEDSDNAQASQVLSGLTTGQEYVLLFNVLELEDLTLRIGSSVGASDFGLYLGSGGGGLGLKKMLFTPTVTNPAISIFVQGVHVPATTTGIDNIIVLENKPVALLDDPVLLWQGAVDTVGIFEGGENSSITVNAENRLIRLENTNERRFTKQDQESIVSGDLGFDYVVGLQEKEIIWGRS